MRELLLGPRSFRELHEALPGINPALLTKRLRDLGIDGLVERNDAPPRSKAVVYELSAAGRALEPAVVALIRAGTAWMSAGPKDDRVDPRWAPLALKALLDGQPARRGRVHVDVEGVAVTVVSRGRRRVAAGHEGRADAHVAGGLPTLLAVATGSQSFGRSELAVSGDETIARSLLGGEPADADVGDLVGLHREGLEELEDRAARP